MGYYKLHPSGLTLDIAVGTGYVVETGVFAIYTYLFIASLPMLTSARRLKDERSARAAWIFLVIYILMYMVATLHLICGAFRFYKGIILINNPKDRTQYLQNFGNWEFSGIVILTYIQTWLGDALVIYRCYVVWDKNMWLIFFPFLLLCGTIGINCYIIYWIGHRVNNFVTIGVLNTIYPLAFAQNFLTTSLIILKILLQHRRSKKAGIVHMGSKIGLMYVVRVIIESAAIYTIQLLLMNILYFSSNLFQYVIQLAVIPSIGITFLLIAIRIEASRNHRTAVKSSFAIRSSIIPRLFVQSTKDSETESEDRERGHPNPRDENP